MRDNNEIALILKRHPCRVAKKRYFLLPWIYRQGWIMRKQNRSYCPFLLPKSVALAANFGGTSLCRRSLQPSKSAITGRD